MGKYHTYHLTLHPGERDPEDVAAELRAALPDALAETTRDHTSLDDVVREDGPNVWIEDGLVRYATGRNWKIQTFDWEDLVPALPVPGRWACAVWQQEVEYNGGVQAFGWVDGGFAMIDDLGGQYGTSGVDALRDVAREWDVTASMEVDPGYHAEPGDRVAEPDPESVPGFEPVDRSGPLDLEATLSDLSASDPDRRRRAVDQLSVLVTEEGVTADAWPALFEAIEDDVTKWAAGAVARSLRVTADDVRRALTADDPSKRWAGARLCEIRGLDNWPTAPLRRRLSDPDARVRAAAARAFERCAIPEFADFPADAAGALVAATRDDDPDVRAAATLAAVRFAFDHEVGDPAAAAEAFARAAFDEDPVVRERLVEYVETNREELAHYLPDAVVEELVVALPSRDAETDAAPPDFVEPLLGYASRWLPETVEPALAELVALGWKRDSPVARAVVTDYLDGAEGERDRALRVRRAIEAADAAAAYDGPELPDRDLDALHDVGDDGPTGDDREPDDSTAADDGAAGDDGVSADTRAAADDATDGNSPPDRGTGRCGLLDWLPF